jgi:hypothetical protein
MVIKLKKLPRWNDGIWLVLGSSTGLVTLRAREVKVTWVLLGSPQSVFQDWRIGALELSLKFLDTVEGPHQ